MTTYETYEADGIDFLVDPLTFDTAGPTTLLGGVVAVDAQNKTTLAKTEGAATIPTATTIRCTFAPWSLPAGLYSVQVKAQPAGFESKTVLNATFWVKASSSAQP